MDEAEQLCDRLVVMDKERSRRTGLRVNFIDQYSTKEVFELRFGADEHENIAPKLDGLAERIESCPTASCSMRPTATRPCFRGAQTRFYAGERIGAPVHT